MKTIEDYKKDLLFKKGLKSNPVDTLRGLIEQKAGNSFTGAIEEMMGRLVADAVEKFVDEMMNSNQTQEAIAQLVLDNIRIPQDGIDGADGRDGIDGYTPEFGIDFLRPNELKELTRAITPKKGTDYFTKSEIKEISQRIKGEVKPIPGVDYPIPQNGKDGIEIAAEDIVDKVNSLPIEPKYQIDARHIKGLPKESTQLGGINRGGVKLIWNTVLTGTVNGSNTVFTIPSSSPLPKASGNVVVEARGNILSTDNNDFTISGRTITFVTAPPNGSNPPRVLIYEAN